jgi:Ni/Co efflux regulator RcnB
MKLMIGATMALTLLGSSAVFAQADTYRSQQQQIEIQNRNSADPRDQSTYTQDQGRNGYQSNGSNQVQDNPHWSRGDRLPAEYRNKQNEVSDWKNNHLRQPPRGYHWVRANNQYVLAAVASGVITDIIMDTQRRR